MIKISITTVTMVFHQSPFTQERTEVQKGINTLHVFDLNYGASPSLGCLESYYELLNLFFVNGFTPS